MIKVRCRPGPDDLPPGYQFGDAGRGDYLTAVVVHTVNGRVRSVRPMTERQRQLMAEIASWNVIEGDHHG